MRILFAGVPVAEDGAMWQVADGGWVYVVADALRAGNGLVTMFVDDLDAEIARRAPGG